MERYLLLLFLYPIRILQLLKLLMLRTRRMDLPRLHLTSRSRMPSWKMHPMLPIGYAAVVHSVCCQVATYMATHLQAVDY